MKTEFTGHFLKDLNKLTQPSIRKKIAKVIEEVEKASKPSEIKNLKKLQGHSEVYRIRCGDYRIGIFIENDMVEFARIAHRSEIYKIFP